MRLVLLVVVAAASTAWAVRELLAAAAASAELSTALTTSVAASQSAADERHARHVIDGIGVSLGVAPSATAALGEHVVVPATVASCGPPAADGTHPGEFRLTWKEAVWYGSDGLDTHRDLALLVPTTVLAGATTAPVAVGTVIALPFVVDADGDVIHLHPVPASFIADGTLDHLD